MYTRSTIARPRRSCPWWREKRWQGRQWLIGRNKARRYNPLVLSRGCLRPFYCPCTRSLCLLVFSPSCKHPRAEGLPEKSFNGIVGIWITRNTIRDQNLVAPLLHPCLAASSLSSNLGVHVWYRVTVHSSTPLSARINCWQLVVVDPQFEILPQKYPPLLFFLSLRVTNFRSSATRGLGGWLHIQRKFENRSKIPRRRYRVILKNNSLLRLRFLEKCFDGTFVMGIGYPYDINFHVTRIEC